MTIFVFGNPDLEIDSLPIRLLPKLKQIFPAIQFQTLDPNEEWDIPSEFIIIDTVFGITKPRKFFSLDDFSNSPRFSVHDFDAFAQLKLLKKLGKLRKITILGLPVNMSEKEALKNLRLELSEVC